MLAGIYGAVLQGADNSRVAELAETVYKQVFSAGTPPVNILTRDYARGIIEYAMWQKLLPSTVDLAKCRPPYKSAWVDGYVTQAELDSYVQTYRNGPGRDEIVGSVINDGDFARYVIDPAVDDWNPAPIGAEKAYTSGDIFNAWLDDFQKFGSEAQHRAFIELIELAKNLKSEIWSRSDEDDAKIKEAEKKLQATMTLMNGVASAQKPSSRHAVGAALASAPSPKQILIGRADGYVNVRTILAGPISCSANTTVGVVVTTATTITTSASARNTSG